MGSDVWIEDQVHFVFEDVLGEFFASMKLEVLAGGNALGHF